MNEYPIEGQVLRKVEEWSDSATGDGGHHDVDPIYPAHADVITSLIEGTADPKFRQGVSGLHKPVLDIDVPAKLIPSSTPGHFHLYIDTAMDWNTYLDLLYALQVAGILEEGFVAASKARGYSSCRLPWIKKDTAPTGHKSMEKETHYD